ncbi:MAG: anti-sigma factor domain-containing protein [Thermoleophilaceae bacterium]
MATFDQLSAEQRAIIELVLKQGQSYEELGTMLGMPTSRVRELARESLVKLSPVSAAAVDADWRGQLADYLLNQQSGPEGTATKGHLRRSEAARGWARSVLDSLEQLYDSVNIPTIPEGEPAAAPRRERKPRREKKAKPAKDDDAEATPRKPSRAPAADAVKRRRLIGAGAAAALIALVVLIWPVGLLVGSGDKNSSGAAKPKKASTQTRILGQLVLKPVGSANPKAAGLAVIAQRGNQRQLIVQAQLPPTKARQAYEVWLYNSQSDAKSMGAQVTDKQGTLQGAATLPANFTKYKFIDVSLEAVDRNAKHSGKSVLRGALADLQAPQQQQQGTAPQSTTPGQ